MALCSLRLETTTTKALVSTMSIKKLIDDLEADPLTTATVRLAAIVHDRWRERQGQAIRCSACRHRRPPQPASGVYICCLGSPLLPLLPPLPLGGP